MNVTARIEARFNIIRTALAIGIAIVIAFILIIVLAPDPLMAISDFTIGPLKSWLRFGNVIESALPILFTGIAVCIMQQGGQYSLIMEGGFIAGAFVAQLVSYYLGLAVGLSQIAALLAAMLIGGILAILPAYMKYHWDASELIASIMLNNIVIGVVTWSLNVYFKDSKGAANQSHKIEDAFMLPNLLPESRVTWGLIIAVAVVIGAYFFMYKSRWGYSIRMTGANKSFAKYSGIAVGSVVLYSQIIGGSIAGLGGAVYQLSMFNRYTQANILNFGWDGMIVAILANRNPVAAVVSALFIAYIKKGADVMQLRSPVPNQVSQVVYSLMIIFVASRLFLEGWKHKAIVKNSRKELLAKEGK